MNLTLNNFMAYILAITMVIQSYSKVFFASDTIFQNIFFYALVFFSILIVSISKFRLIDIFLIITSLIIYLAFGNGFALKLFLVSLAVRCLDINKLLRCYLLLATIAFITVILFNVGGDNSLIYFKGDGVFRIARETLGFDNPNKPFYYLLPIFCCFVFLNSKLANRQSRCCHCFPSPPHFFFPPVKFLHIFREQSCKSVECAA